MSKITLLFLSMLLATIRTETSQSPLTSSHQNNGFLQFLNAVRYQYDLNEEQIERFVPLEERIEGRNFKGAGILQKTENYYKLLIDYNYQQSESNEGRLMVTYNPNGTLNSFLVFSESIGNCRVGSLTNFIIQNNQVAITRQGVWQDKCTETTDEKVIDFFIMREYKIYDDGYMKLIHQTTIGPYRKYPGVSTRILSNLDLDLLSSNDIDYMRNELFADYGYKFKSERWRYIFEDQPWYQPKADEIPIEWLSTIEKRNLKLILAYKAKK